MHQICAVFALGLLGGPLGLMVRGPLTTVGWLLAFFPRKTAVFFLRGDPLFGRTTTTTARRIPFDQEHCYQNAPLSLPSSQLSTTSSILPIPPDPVAQIGFAHSEQRDDDDRVVAYREMQQYWRHDRLFDAEMDPTDG